MGWTCGAYGGFQEREVDAFLAELGDELFATRPSSP